MGKYLTDPNGMNEPWISSPFFETILEANKEKWAITKEQEDLCRKFNSDGYVIVDLELSPTFIDHLKSDIQKSIDQDRAKKQSEKFHYSDSPRVFEAWRYSKYVRELACHDKIGKILNLFYRKPPKPFQTINFVKGSSQPGHSDTIHFHTQPKRWMAACWTALEDIDEENGALFVYPGSHKLPVYDLQDLNFSKQDYDDPDRWKEAYTSYEEFLIDLMGSIGLERDIFVAKAGHAIIWEANLIHGGIDILDKDRTRWSQATHYYFPGCKHYYCPLYSDVPNGIYSEKDLSEKDIWGMHLEEDVGYG